MSNISQTYLNNFNVSTVANDTPLNLTIPFISGTNSSAETNLSHDNSNSCICHDDKTAKNADNSSGAVQSSPDLAKLKKLSVRKVYHLNSKVKLIFKNLTYLWPPENIALSRKNGKLDMKGNCFAYAMRFLKGRNYSPSLHNDVDFMKLLSSSFEESSILDKNRLKDLQEQIGLSKMAIKLWYKWKREISGLFSPVQILSSAFQELQYLSLNELHTLCDDTNLSPTYIQSWFRVTRALANVFDQKKVDKEEIILWRMFNFRNDGLSDADVHLMSYILDMNSVHIYQIFSTWCQRYDVSNNMTPQTNDTIFEKINTSKQPHVYESPYTTKKYLLDDKNLSSCIVIATQPHTSQSLNACSNHHYKRSSSCPSKLDLHTCPPLVAFNEVNNFSATSCDKSRINKDHLPLKKCHSMEKLDSKDFMNFSMSNFLEKEINMSKKVWLWTLWNQVRCIAFLLPQLRQCK